MYKLPITLGDWSNDGHGRTERFEIISNKSAEDVANAYVQACKISGIIFHSDVASDYDDRSFPAEKFKVLGCPDEILVGDYQDDEDDLSSYGVTHYEHYLELFMWFCTLGDSELELSISQEMPSDLVHNIYAALRREADEKQRFLGRHIGSVTSHFGYGLEG